MNKKTLINIVMLSLTSLLLIITMFSWYVSNKQVSANGITASTAEGNFDLVLEKGTYDTTHKTWTWEPTKSLSITNMQPNDVFFFRFKITAKTTGNLKVTLSNIKSEAVNSVVKLDIDNKSVLISGVKTYELDSSNNVVIKNGNTTLGTLYSYATGKFSLVDYEIQDTFNYYNYGLGTEDFYNPKASTQEESIYYTENISECPNDPQDLTNITETYNISASKSYAYFALEFNNTKSEVTYTHIDGAVKKDSNLYQAQSLVIATIGVEEV